MESTKILVIAICCLSCVVAENEQCLKGTYHKDSPTPETDEYKACSPWKNLTCCTVDLDREVAQNDSPKKYNQSWHKCSNLSSECLKYWKYQECFYQCSPYIYKWKDGGNPGAVTGVPICASDCDAWFDACKNDEICVENVLEDYNVTDLFQAVCPVNRPCKNYTEMFGSGKELCEKLWGSSYKYTNANAEKDNCMVLWFSPDAENPNKRVQKEANSGRFHNALVVLFLFPIFQVFYFIFSF